MRHTGRPKAIRLSSPESALPAVRWAENLLVLVLVAGFVWRAFLPAWKTPHTDFLGYYLGARLFHEGYPLDRLYEISWLQRQKDHAGIGKGLVGFVPLTPFSVFPMLALSNLPALLAMRCWLAVNIVLLCVSGFLLRQITSLGARRVAIVALLAFSPLQANFLYGQYHVLMLFLLTLALWFYLRDLPLGSGLALSLGAALKVYPIFFAFYFLRKKQWRALIGLISGAIGLGLLALHLFGFETMRVYMLGVLPRSLRGDSGNPYIPMWSSFTAALNRLFINEPEWNPHPLLHHPTAYAVLQPLSQALLFVPALWLIGPVRADAEKEKLAWGSYIALLTILSTHPASYHHCILIITGVLVADYFMSAYRRKEAGVLIILYGLACFPLYKFGPESASGWKIFLTFPHFYALTALWIFVLWSLTDSVPLTFASRLKARETLIFGVLFLAIMVAGTWANLRHLQGRFANYASRLVVIPRSALAIEPAVGNNEVLFTTISLNWDYYLTAWLHQGSVALLNLGADTFHPALAPDSSSAWVELASTKSRIIRLSLRAWTAPREGVTVEVEDAEQPVVSADGRWLLFTRAIRGHGSLWLKQLGPVKPGASMNAAVRELVGPGYDVREAAFLDDHRIIFAGKPGRSSRLFVVAMESSDIRELKTSPGPVRFPAVSPDGKWLALSRNEWGAWHIWVMNLATGDERRVSDTDCNDVTPAWLPDSRGLLYATDCGRAFGLTALCRVRAVP